MSKELELIAAGMAATSPTGTGRFEDMSQWNQQRWLSRAAHVLAKLSEHGYSIVPSDSRIYVRVSETFTDDDGVLRDSQNGDIVSTFDWSTLHSVPVGVTRIASQSGRVAAFNQVAGWYWADGEGFPEQDGYDGPWCVASEVKP